jgi:hypothetical protein
MWAPVAMAACRYRKAFFFEKKKQKTLGCFGADLSG